eukprot:355122_1
MKRINAFLKQFINILKEHTDEIGPKLIFRVKTILTYYKKTLNTIPDFDLFVAETDIANRITSENLRRFRKRYDEEMGKSQTKKIQSMESQSPSLKSPWFSHSYGFMFMSIHINLCKFFSIFCMSIHKIGRA